MRDVGVVLPKLCRAERRRISSACASRVTIPKAQSVISCSPVNHSSVQAKKIGAGETAFHHAVDMPAEHFGLLFFAVANRVHPEFAQHKRPFFREILQTQQVTFEVALIVQVNVEAEEIDVLRQQIFRRRKTGVGKENLRIDRAPDAG